MNPDIDISPCLKCENHLAGIDKTLCLSNCKKLKAYQTGKADWTKEEVFIVAEGKDLVEDISGEFDEEIEIPEKGEAGIGVIPEAVQVCAICGKKEGADNRFMRGVCRNPCYMKWYTGKIEHPVLGKFKRAPREEVEYPAGDLNNPNEKKDNIFNADKDICEQTATINMDNYPLIKVDVYRLAVRLSLPVSHIIITLLAEALEARRGNDGYS